MTKELQKTGKDGILFFCKRLSHFKNNKLTTENCNIMETRWALIL